MQALSGFMTVVVLSALWLPRHGETVRSDERVRVPILVYHSVAVLHPDEVPRRRAYNVEPPVFEAQMQMLRDEGYTVISLSALADALVGGPPVPARAVVITFDDGWRTQFENAFPVLARMGFTATFFVFTAPIGRDPRFMTWADLRAMQSAGMSIGSHSRTHPYLTRSHSLTMEIVGSRKDIERVLGRAPDFFAYPFGENAARLKAAVDSAGYRGARGFGGGVRNSADDLWNLHSVPVTADLSVFRCLLRGTAEEPRTRRPETVREPR
jgi:peptidoglycan/xylan/chitin deacetylase (PgdA/CDA1 family)